MPILEFASLTNIRSFSKSLRRTKMNLLVVSSDMHSIGAYPGNTYTSNAKLVGDSPVAPLIGRSSPAAVVGGIVPVNVNTVDGMGITGCIPHIFIERLKGLPRRVVDNASAVVADVFGPVASCLHVYPATIRPAGGLAVGSTVGGNGFALKASAAFNGVIPELRGRCDMLITAVANAVPCILTKLVLPMPTDNFKPIEFLSNHVGSPMLVISVFGPHYSMENV